MVNHNYGFLNLDSMIKSSFLLVLFVFSLAFSYGGGASYSIIDELEKALFGDKLQTEEVLQLLQQIRINHGVDLVPRLSKIHARVVEKAPTTSLKRMNSYARLKYEIEATIIFLEMKAQPLADHEARSRHLLNRMRDKLDAKGVVNAELILLQEFVTEATPFLLAEFDRSEDERLQAILLRSFSDSKFASLEGEVIERVGHCDASSPIYLHLLMLLSKVGGQDSFALLSSLAAGNQDSGAERKQFVTECIKKMGERTTDKQLQERIGAYLQTGRN